MPRITLSKSSLTAESRRLATYERFLPSLDLKRKQLLAERAKAARALDEAVVALDALRRSVGERLPMLAMPLSGLDGIARVQSVRLGSENLVGTKLPVLQDVQVELRRYPLLGKPHWVDTLEVLLTEALRLDVRRQVLARRLALLDEAVRTLTQRVNLFDKVLIPRTRENIRKIRIFLADAERAAVVRAKIAKRKRAAAGA